MKRWYVVQVYAGFEEQVKADLARQIVKEGLQDLFGEVLIPSAKVRHFFEGEEPEQQLFPGYVLLEMELTPPAMRLVLSSPRVTKFLGGQEPAPLSKKEIDRIMSLVTGEVSVHAPTTADFIEGTEVEIVDGPFSGFMGLIDKVDKETDKLSVMVSIFGRSTPVELRFDQVKR
jgi:transcription termination/antitermination protein NusG